MILKYNLGKHFDIQKYTITCPETKSEIITVGIKDTRDEQKLKSIHGVTGIWIEEATELYVAVDQATHKMERQLKKYNEKLHNHRVKRGIKDISDRQDSESVDE